MQIERCQVSEGILNETRDRQQHASERLETAKSTQDKAKVPQDLTALNREINELHEKMSTLRQARLSSSISLLDYDPFVIRSIMMNDSLTCEETVYLASMVAHSLSWEREAEPEAVV